MSSPKRSLSFRGRWLQLSLKTLMLSIVMVALLLAFFVVPARSQFRSRQWVASQQGQIYLTPKYRAEGAWYVASGAWSLPKRLVDTIGIDFFASVKHVVLDCEEIHDLSGIRGFTRLEGLHINQFVHDIRALDTLRDLHHLKKVTLSKWSGLSTYQFASIAKSLPGVQVVRE